MPDASFAPRLDAIRAMVDRVARSEGMELVDVEFQPAGRLLRVFLDKPGGITHADCELISRQVSTILDVEDLVPGDRRYVLEVSSPGLDRRLVKADDYRRFAGQRVKIVTRQPIENRRNFSGLLEGLGESNRVRLRLEKDQLVDIELENIQKANLIPTW